MQVLSKGDFAAHIGVSAGRVSQYIAAGMIGPDALDGQGRNAKVIVAAAIEQIKRKRDIGQALGNGISTRLELPLDDGPQASAEAAGSSPEPRKTDGVDDLLKQERLQAERRRNRLAAEDEAARRGQLVEAAKVKAEMTKKLVSQREAFAAMLADLATEVNAKYGVPQRDCLHLFRKVFTEGMAKVAERERRLAAGLPETVEAIIEDTAA